MTRDTHDTHKDERKRRTPQQPADAGVYHHAQTVIADVTLATSRKAERHMAKASAVAHQVVQLADRLSAYIESAEPIENMSGARAARVRRSFAPLMRDVHGKRDATTLAALVEVLGAFVNEHRASFDCDPDGVMKTIVRFIEWANARLKQLDVRVDAFKAEYEKAIEEDRERLDKLAEDWSAVDGDGLS